MTEHEMLELILQKITGLDDKMTGLEDKVTGLEDKVTGLEDKVTSLEDKVTGLEDKVTGLDGKVTGLENKVTGLEDGQQNILQQIDEKITASEERMMQKMDEKLTCSENLILRELDRVQEHLETDVQKVQRNLEELQQYYRITKLENDNTSLLLKMYNDMQKEIEELKAKIA